MSTVAAPFTIHAPAKLNLFLHILGRREDGYHELQTIFQLLDFGDELQFSPQEDQTIALRCEGPLASPLLAADDNLVLRAAHLVREHVRKQETKDTLPGIGINLIKRVPMGGGLGGGSSDAASTLIALNHIWELGLSTVELAQLGKQLGADVPVFVHGHSAWAEGIGEQLTPVELPDRWYLVVTPNCHVSTPLVFSHPQLTRDTPAITIAAFFAGSTQNDCESVVRRIAKPVDNALKILEKFGNPRMTGSGASVFLAFDNAAEASAVSREIAGEIPTDWQQFVARGINRSPTQQALQRAG